MARIDIETLLKRLDSKTPEQDFNEKLANLATPVPEPVADEPVADEPVADEPVADEPVADEPVADEPVADEPVADEPVADEPVTKEAELSEQELEKIAQNLDAAGRIMARSFYEEFTKLANGQEENEPVEASEEIDLEKRAEAQSKILVSLYNKLYK